MPPTNHINSNVILVRALKTFVQAFLAFLSTGIVTTVSVPATKALIGGALAAGFSAAMNLFLAPQEPK